MLELWWSPHTIWLLACQVNVTAVGSGLHCCIPCCVRCLSSAINSHCFVDFTCCACQGILPILSMTTQNVHLPPGCELCNVQLGHKERENIMVHRLSSITQRFAGIKKRKEDVQTVWSLWTDCYFWFMLSTCTSAISIRPPINHKSWTSFRNLGLL